MTPAKRRFWLWVNVVCLAVALACILVGLTQDAQPVFQGVLFAVGVVALVLGVGSAIAAAVKVRGEQRRN